MLTAEELDRNRDLQRTLYGQPLGELLRRVGATLGLSQARLADTLGLSAPMLSQLANAQRVKIGNPAVVPRLQALSDLASAVEAGGLDADELPARIASVRDVAGVITTMTRVRAQAELQALLAEVAPAADIAAAARLLEPEYPRIAAFLRTYGNDGTGPRG